MKMHSRACEYTFFLRYARSRTRRFSGWLPACVSVCVKGYLQRMYCCVAAALGVKLIT